MLVPFVSSASALNQQKPETPQRWPMLLVLEHPTCLHLHMTAKHSLSVLLLLLSSALAVLMSFLASPRANYQSKKGNAVGLNRNLVVTSPPTSQP